MLEDGTAPLVAHWSARSFRAMTRRAGAVLALALFVVVSPLDRLGVAADSPTLSAGARHTCAIDAADALHCWGDDSDGQTRVPADVAAWRAVAAAKGGCHTCGLALDGAARCWGCDANGEVSGVPTVPGGNRWISVGAGKGVSCGVAAVDRAVRCWGRFMPQVGANPWYGPWSRVTVGEDWVCALSANDAKARCRGWSANGQTNVPPSLANAAWLDLSAGFQHVCGVLATSPRSLACWGSGAAGESTPPTPTEEEMAADPSSSIGEFILIFVWAIRLTWFFLLTGSWGGVSAGTHVTCGIVGAQRRLKCWGKALDYVPGSEYAAAFGEFGQVAGAADVATWGTIVSSSGGDSSGGGACSWDVVATGKHHACAIVAQPSSSSGAASNTNDSSNVSSNVDASLRWAAKEPGSTEPGRVVCWGDESGGKTRVPSAGVTLPWRAWPATFDDAVDVVAPPFGFTAQRTAAVGTCATVSAALGGRSVAGGAGWDVFVSLASATLATAAIALASSR